jgi:glyoxylase-like metal-dependent hydrolase (beta-lactamase superfamily II)
MIRVHHLACGHMSPLGARLLVGPRPAGAPAFVCHCLLIETEAGLVLVDSGIGLLDVAHPAKRLGRSFVFTMGAQLDEALTAARQMEALGFSQKDVRHIVLTHLDLDHAGGLSDFPEAKVHVYAAEHRAALRRETLLERERYRPIQWAHGPHWRPYETSGERWMGFECVRELEGLPPEILLVPLGGHTRGHSGVAVQVDGGWRLHAGDAYFHRGEVDPQGPHCPPALRVYQQAIQLDGPTRLENQRRLRELAQTQGDTVRIFSAHDRVEFERLRTPKVQVAGAVAPAA